MALCPLNKCRYETWYLNRIEEAGCVVCSPCTSRVGVVLQDKKSLRILRIDYTLRNSQEILTYHSNFEIEDMKWSPDGSLLLLVSLQESQFTVINCLDSESIFRVQDPNTVCLASVQWAPDSEHLISISTFNIFTFAHSSADGRRIFLPSVCCTDDGKPLLAFSHNGKFAASVTFHTSAYHINLLSTSSWNILWDRKCDLQMIQGLEWTSDSSILAVWNSYKQVSFFCINGENMKQLLYDNFMCSGFLIGIFSPKNDLFIATCFHDENNLIIVYNLITWQLSAVLNNNQIGCQSNPSGLTKAGSSQLLMKSNFSVKGQLSFSHCGTLLASTLFKGHIVIWNLREGFEPCKVLETSSFFTGLQWHHKKPQIGAITSNGTVLVWKFLQGGPIDKKDKLCSVKTNSTVACTVLWSKSNLIISPLKGMQHLIVLLKKKRSKK